MLLIQRPCDDLENSLRLLGVHVEASQRKQARTNASSCQIAEGLTYSPHVEEAYEAIHNQHEEAQRGTGAHNDQGDQPLRQALISKAILHTRASFAITCAYSCQHLAIALPQTYVVQQASCLEPYVGIL